MTTETDTKTEALEHEAQTESPSPQRALAPSERRSALDRPDVNLIEHSPFNSMHAFGVANRMAEMLSSSSIVPDTYRTWVQDKDNGWMENPAAVGNCFIAIELANRLKTSPILIMQQVDMIHGRPALRGTLLIGLINASRLFSPIMFERKGEKDTDADYGYRAVATNLETGDVCEGPWVDWKMVRAEGWPEKRGSKWKTMPEQMFRYRAAAFWSRIFAPHITLGLYESEEARETVEDAPTRAALLERKLADAGETVAQLAASTVSAAAFSAATTSNGGEAAAEAAAPTDPAPEKDPKPRSTRRKVKQDPVETTQHGGDDTQQAPAEDPEPERVPDPEPAPEQRQSRPSLDLE